MLKLVVLCLLALSLVATAGPVPLAAGGTPGRSSAVVSYIVAGDGVPLSGGWTEVATSTLPPAMAGGMMAYSTRDGVFLVFGGWDGLPLNETWVFDPSLLVWAEIAQARSPPARGDGMLVYDESDDAFILFGGWEESPPGVYHRLGDTWTFHLHNSTWVQRIPLVSPSPRSDSAVAYSSADDVVFLVGGFDGSAYLADEWYYSYQDHSWSPLESSPAPSPRADGRMVYDDDRDLFFLFGGNDFSGPNFTFHHLGDTWAYSWPRKTWTAIATEQSPPPRDYAIFATLAGFGELLLFGGYGHFEILGDVWAFNTTLNAWRDITVPGGPPPRFAGVGGFAVANGALVVFGGLADEGLLADTWFFVYPPPISGDLLVSSSDPIVGRPLTFAAKVRGGSGSWVNQQWDFGDGGTGTGLSAAHSFSTPGVFRVEFEVEDSLGGGLVFVMTVSVGLFVPLWADFLLLTVAIAGVVIFMFAWMRLRRDRKTVRLRAPTSDFPEESAGAEKSPRDDRTNPDGNTEELKDRLA